MTNKKIRVYPSAEFILSEAERAQDGVCVHPWFQSDYLIFLGVLSALGGTISDRITINSNCLIPGWIWAIIHSERSYGYEAQ
jgi:hypothetical protein